MVLETVDCGRSTLVSSSHPLPVEETEEVVDERPRLVRFEYLEGGKVGVSTESGLLVWRLACHFGERYVVDWNSMCLVFLLYTCDGGRVVCWSNGDVLCAGSEVHLGPTSFISSG